MKVEILYRLTPARDGDYAGRIVVWRLSPWEWTGADLAGGRAVTTVEVGEALMEELRAGRLKVDSGALVPLPEELWPPTPDYGDEGGE